MTNPYAPMSNDEERARLLHLLKTHHVSQEKAIKKSDLLTEMWGATAAADKSYNSRYDRSLRLMIEDLNHNGEVICSDSVRGYWYAASLEDGLPAADKNEARALTQLENARQLKQNIIAAYGGQMRLV